MTPETIVSRCNAVLREAGKSASYRVKLQTDRYVLEEHKWVPIEQLILDGSIIAAVERLTGEKVEMED